ncbi:PerC family transcriptional regulator, partial [Escherichia coli]
RLEKGLRSKVVGHLQVIAPLRVAVVEMMQKAQELSDKGLYQRAATVLMEAFNRSKNEEVREKILIERQRCLSRVQKVKAPSDVWALAGNYARNA